MNHKESLVKRLANARATVPPSPQTLVGTLCAALRTLLPATFTNARENRRTCLEVYDRLVELGSARDDRDALSRGDHVRVLVERGAVGWVGQRARTAVLAVVVLLLVRVVLVVLLLCAKECPDLLGQLVLAGRLRALGLEALGLFHRTSVLEHDLDILHRDEFSLCLAICDRDGGATRRLGALRRGLPARAHTHTHDA